MQAKADANAAKNKDALLAKTVQAATEISKSNPDNLCVKYLLQVCVMFFRGRLC